MIKPGRFTTLVPAVALFVLGSGAANAYEISIVGTPQQYGQNFGLTASSSRISLSDFFDQYDETQWQVSSTEEMADGRVHVNYNFPVYGNWDSYGASTTFQFQILSDPGDLSPAPVAVDFWGSSFYERQQSNACCYSEAPRVRITGASPVPRYTATNGSYNLFDASYELQTNTIYGLNYTNFQYVEGTPEASNLPAYFGSWAEYNSFVASRGTSGTISASAFGFMNYNLAVEPRGVPEPGTLALFGIGLAGVFFARRRLRV